MQTLTPWTEQWQHFTSEIREQFWGDLAQHTRQSWQDLLGRLSIEARDRYLGVREYERSPERTDARNGFYDRDFVTRLGTLRVRVARTRQRAFLPAGLMRLERRAAEVLLLIREAFLRGLSTRTVGRVVALVTEEPVSAQTVSRLTRDLDQAVAQFHQARLSDDWRYLFLDGVSLRVRRPSGRKRVQLLVAYGVRVDGTRHLLGFTRSTGESQVAWEGLLHRSLSARPRRPPAPAGRDRWLCRVGGGPADGLSPRGASALLGPQAAQSAGGGAAAGSRGHEGRCPGDLSGGRAGPRRWPRRRRSHVGGGTRTRSS